MSGSSMASSTTSSTTSSTASGTRSSRRGRLASRRHATPQHPCAGQTGKPVGLVARWAEVPRAVLRVVCAVEAGSTRAEPRRTVAEPLRPSPPSGSELPEPRGRLVSTAFRSKVPDSTRRDHSKFSFYAISLFSRPYSCEEDWKLPPRDVLPEEKSGSLRGSLQSTPSLLAHDDTPWPTLFRGAGGCGVRRGGGQKVCWRIRRRRPRYLSSLSVTTLEPTRENDDESDIEGLRTV